VNAWCVVFSRFVAVGTLSVLVFSALVYVFSCVHCVLLVDWRCFANVLWWCEFEIAPTLFRYVLEFRCGWYPCGRLKKKIFICNTPHKGDLELYSTTV